ncbi:type IV pilin [Halohasta salina]|uniref:type IV pilin n=1 Tax=Halohasta salina TaxID=2961621 RepID=UPI0020A57A4B|nr:type IV pilin N-terminal domain-containing protein [Halohasta salina]
MQRSQFGAENRGAAPVIGVVLMVSIAVILAAAVGGYVLNEGDQIPENVPQASFSYDYDDTENVTITHTGGDSIDNGTIEILIDGAEAYPNPAASTNVTDPKGWDGTIGSGDSVELYNDSSHPIAEGGETVRIVWNDPDGGSSTTIGQSEWPN